MRLQVGFIPYLNMVPFQQGFGPQPLEKGKHAFEFVTLSPRHLGQEAEKGVMDAGALSLVDLFRLLPQYEPLGHFGIGVQRAANSVLFFSKQPIEKFSGICAVTDETSTSFRLLQLLLDVRYQRSDVRYGRIASSSLFDGDADGLLLIGDEALRARQHRVPGLPYVADLGEEWFAWQGVPFVFARWAVRQGLPQEVKDIIEISIENSIKSMENRESELAIAEGEKRAFTPRQVEAYWQGFAWRLTEPHLKSIDLFSKLLEKQCLTA